MPGRAIRIFLVDGTPTGLRTAEIGLSTCKAVVASRGGLDALNKRSEAHRTGVYVLVGEDPNTPGRLAIYVGEGDEVFERIAMHERNEEKDFWDRVMLFVSKDENLTKAHVRQIEARLVQIAKQAKRCTVLNKNDPTGGLLPEADSAEMEEFVTQICLLASMLGVQAFEPAPETDQHQSQAEAGTGPRVLSMSGQGYHAQCRIVDGEFVVEQGSIARQYEAPTLAPSSQAARKELLAAGVLEQIPEGLRFAQNYAFSSASGAAQVIAGANVNGKTAWKFADGTTLKDWLESQIA